MIWTPSILLWGQQHPRPQQEEGTPAHTVCGGDVRNCLLLVQQSTPAAVDYDHIVVALQKHYHPRLSEINSWALFQGRDLMGGEAISAYVAALKKLAADTTSERCPKQW